MLNVNQNLKQGSKSSIHISTEEDRKLIKSMVRGNILQEPVSFDDLVLAINNSNGRILEYRKRNHVVVYFDSTGKYISDYKGVYGKPGLGSTESVKTNVEKTAIPKIKKPTLAKSITVKPDTPKKNVKMYRGAPIN